MIYQEAGQAFRVRHGAATGRAPPADLRPGALHSRPHIAALDGMCVAHFAPPPGSRRLEPSLRAHVNAWCGHAWLRARMHVCLQLVMCVCVCVSVSVSVSVRMQYHLTMPCNAHRRDVTVWRAMR